MSENSRKRMTAAVLWGGLLVGFGLTRMICLMELPAGYHVDEAGMAYDAWCLSQYGVDRYLKSWPVYLTNFGSGQSSLYAFLCALLFKVFGWHRIIIRIPAVLFSLLTLVFGVKTAQKVYGQNSYFPYAAGALLVICPYFILAGRFGLDCNLMLGMSTVFLYFLIDALEKGTCKSYMAAGITGGLVLYTYALTYIILPLFLVLSLVYCIVTGKFTWKKWALMALPMGILAAPLIAVQVINLLDLKEMTWGIFTITKLETYRAGELGHFSPENLIRAWNSIFNGDSLKYNSIPGIPNLYGKTSLLFLLGLMGVIGKTVVSIKNKSWKPCCLIFLWFLSILLLSAHIESNVNKINGIFFSVILLTVEGVWTLWQVRGWIGRGICCAWVLIYCWGFLRFGQYYYGGGYMGNDARIPYFDVTVEEALAYIEDHPQYRDRVTYMAEADVFFALSSRISPYELRIWEREDNRYGNYVWSRLGEPEEGCNYIVEHSFDQYMETLRQTGFQEIDYGAYSLFYME